MCWKPDHIYSLVAHLPIRNHFRVTEDSKHPEDRDGLIWALRMRNLVHQAELLKARNPEHPTTCNRAG